MEPPGASASISPTQQLQQLPTAVQLHVLSLLPPNERALSARSVCRDAWAAFATDDHLTASLSQPLPLYAAAWAEVAGQQHVRRLPFRHKLQLLSTAAASGSEVNLGVALAVLQPSIFPELLQRGGCAIYPDPGVAAVRDGHVHLLAWLQARCPGLLHPDRVLQVAARHCQLQGLQRAWAALAAGNTNGGSPPVMDQRVLDAAAQSATPDTVVKMEWVLAAGHGSCRLQESTAAAAARSGDRGRLRWLHAQGCPMAGHYVLGCALEHADLATVQWLVGEAGCNLPAAGSSVGSWSPLLEAAAQSCEGVVKLRWLAEQGAPPLDTVRGTVCRLALASARAGRVEVLRHLMSVYGYRALLDGHEAWRLLGFEPGEVGVILPAEAAAELLVPQAATGGHIPVLDYLRQAGVAMRPWAYAAAAAGGHVATVRWLAQEAGVHLTRLEWYTLYGMINDWPRDSSSQNRGLLEAVKLLADEVCRGWNKRGWNDCRSKMQVLCAAVHRGDVALVKYLQQQLRWPAHWFDLYDIDASAAAVDCEELLDWLAKHGGFWGPLRACLTLPFAPPYMVAARNADRGTLSALRRLGVPWGAEDKVACAVHRGCAIPVVRWLAEQGAPVGNARVLEAAVARRVHEGSLSGGEEAWLWALVGPTGFHYPGAHVLTLGCYNFLHNKKLRSCRGSLDRS